MTVNNYTTLSDTEVIKLSIDFVKVGQVLPFELRSRLQELNLLSIIDPRGTTDEED